MITIKRWYHNDCTIGRLSLGDFHCFTLELPDLDNQRSISCIPEGNYTYHSRTNGKNGHVIELENVPNRTYIQVHAGNYVSQIEGCILTGDSIKWINRDDVPDVGNSKKTLTEFLKLAGKSGKIRIES